MTFSGGLYGPAFVTEHTEKQSLPLEKELRQKIHFAEEVLNYVSVYVWLSYCKVYEAEYYDDE